MATKVATVAVAVNGHAPKINGKTIKTKNQLRRVKAKQKKIESANGSLNGNGTPIEVRVSSRI